MEFTFSLSVFKSVCPHETSPLRCMHLQLSHDNRILSLVACELLLSFYVKSLVTCVDLNAEDLYS